MNSIQDNIDRNFMCLNMNNIEDIMEAMGCQYVRNGNHMSINLTGDDEEIERQRSKINKLFGNDATIIDMGEFNALDYLKTHGVLDKIKDDKRDFHLWNVDSSGKIRDNEYKKVWDEIAKQRLGHKDYSFVYKEWDRWSKRSRLPPYIRKILTRKSEIIDEKLPTRQERVEVVKTIGYANCDAVCLLKVKLYGWKIKCGSQGIKCNKTGKIWWEFGNGEKKAWDCYNEE